MNNYLNLEEAIEITGLNEKTLQRFITAGYIQTRADNQLVLLSISDLNKTFGLNVAEPAPSKVSELKIEVTNLASDENDTEKDPKIDLQQATIPTPIEAQESNPNHKSKIDETILEKVIALQDRLIEDKESQINEQLGEIRWLRTRIEKLEEQAEKDKILLLSGNQTINRLIELNGNKRSWFGRTLTWLGNKEQ